MLQKNYVLKITKTPKIVIVQKSAKKEKYSTFSKIIKIYVA
jgi:hypothetical protein